MDEVISRIADQGILQPCLFKLNGFFHVKVDNRAIAVHDAGCFVEAVEFLFMCFWVFNVQYPTKLRLLYTFLEDVAGMRNSKPQVPTLRDFHRDLMSLS